MSCQWIIYNRILDDDNFYWLTFGIKNQLRRFVELFKLGIFLAERQRDMEQATLKKMLAIVDAFKPGPLGTKGVVKIFEEKLNNDSKKGRDGLVWRRIYGGMNRMRKIFRTM